MKLRKLKYHVIWSEVKIAAFTSTAEFRWLGTNGMIRNLCIDCSIFFVSLFISFFHKSDSPSCTYDTCFSLLLITREKNNFSTRKFISILRAKVGREKIVVPSTRNVWRITLVLISIYVSSSETSNFCINSWFIVDCQIGKKCVHLFLLLA